MLISRMSFVCFSVRTVRSKREPNSRKVSSIGASRGSEGWYVLEDRLHPAFDHRYNQAFLSGKA